MATSNSNAVRTKGARTQNLGVSWVPRFFGEYIKAKERDGSSHSPEWKTIEEATKESGNKISASTMRKWLTDGFKRGMLEKRRFCHHDKRGKPKSFIHFRKKVKP